MEGLNDYLTGFLITLGASSVFLLLVRPLPDFARNLTILLASLAAIELFTSPFYLFGLVAGTGLVYYALFWLQWNSRKTLYCRLIALGLIGLSVPLFLWGGHFVWIFGAVFLILRLLTVTWTVGRGRPLPSDPLEFFVYAFFFPTFFIIPLQSLDGFRANLTAERRPKLTEKGSIWQFLRIALGLVLLFVFQFLDQRFHHRDVRLGLGEDLALAHGAVPALQDVPDVR